MEEESGRRAHTGVLQTFGHQHRRPRQHPSHSIGAQRAAAPGRLAAERGRGAGPASRPPLGRWGWAVASDWPRGQGVLVARGQSRSYGLEADREHNDVDEEKREGAEDTPEGVAELPLPAGARRGGDPRAVFYAAILDTVVSLHVAATAPTECRHAAYPARPQPLRSRNGDGGILAKAERHLRIARHLRIERHREKFRGEKSEK